MFLINTISLSFQSTEVKSYYSTTMPFITRQPTCRHDVAPSVLETNAMAVTAAAEWENEWNHSGLASRLSKEVCVSSATF